MHRHRGKAPVVKHASNHARIDSRSRDRRCTRGDAVSLLDDFFFFPAAPIASRPPTLRVPRGGAVFAPDNHLAPENPAPAARDDAFAVYQSILKQGYAPAKMDPLRDRRAGARNGGLAGTSRHAPAGCGARFRCGAGGDSDRRGSRRARARGFADDDMVAASHRPLDVARDHNNYRGTITYLNLISSERPQPRPINASTPSVDSK
jgi:alpha/beta hydrolase fold